MQLTHGQLIARMGIVTRLRWWIFRRLSEIGWRVCPEPMRSDLRARTKLDLT